MKKLAYITGSRAEYGIVKRLLLRLQQDPTIEFSLIVTAMHLSDQYGNTVEIIKQDGFIISEQIPLTLNNENNQAIIHSMAECLDKFGKHFHQYHYDAIMVLGDRYEMLAVATAAAMHNIPIIHLHGGEQTLGNYDEFIRHSITKMSKLHLTSTEVYRQRVIQLGEPPESVVNIGALGAENSLSLSLPSKNDLEKALHVDLSKPYFLVVFHPETLISHNVHQQTYELLVALDKFKNDYNFIFIGPNSDTNSNEIFNCFSEFTKNNNMPFLVSVKPEEYLALMKYSKGIIGNSSSGILEAPSCGIGSVNIGNRQKGRVRGDSVIDVENNTIDIINGIHKLVSDEFKNKVSNTKNPYYKVDAAINAYHIIRDFIFSDNRRPKQFFDLYK